MLGTVTLTDLVPNEHVSSRQVLVTINGTALPPIEAILSPAQFTCNDGDDVIVTPTDINAAGPTEGAPFEVTASLPLSPPTAPSVVGITFSDGSSVSSRKKK